MHTKIPIHVHVGNVLIQYNIKKHTLKSLKNTGKVKVVLPQTDR